MNPLDILRQPQILESLTKELPHCWVNPRQKQNLNCDIDQDELQISSVAYDELLEAVTKLQKEVVALGSRVLIPIQMQIDEAQTCGTCLHRCPVNALCMVPERENEGIQVSQDNWACSLYLNRAEVMQTIGMEEEF